MNTRIRPGAALCMMLAFGLLMLGGCGSKKPKNRAATLEGNVESIDLATRQVSMSFYNKNGKSVIVTGELVDGAEVYIDGKLSDLTKIKVSDNVIVEGFQQGANVAATRVEVFRKTAPPERKGTDSRGR